MASFHTVTAIVMTLFSWLKPKSDARPGGLGSPAAQPQPGRPQGRPANAPHRAAAPGPENEDGGDRLKTERARMREQLYAVVRESMVRVGFLSSNFKFKILAADAKGNRFIVMMDLPHTFGGDISQLAEVEPVICRAARVRHGLTVVAVYWRADLPQPSAAAQSNGAPQQAPDPSVLPSMPPSVPPMAPQAATGAPPRPAVAVPAALASISMPPVAARPTPPPVATPAPVNPDKPGYDPVLAEEMSALKRALAAGSSALSAAVGAATAPKTNPVMLTGYESTEIIDSQLPAGGDARDNQATVLEPQPEDDPFPLLSPTQYGDLR